MGTVLMTGGAGFIGSNVAEGLLKKGFRVVILDNLSTGRMENIEPLLGGPDIKFVEGSILDSRLLSSIMEADKVTLVCHQAARPSVARSIEDPVKTTDINVTGAVTVFNAAAKAGIKRVVYASSSSVYGDTPELPKVETMPLRPKSPYAASKAADEVYADVFSKLYGMEIFGLRYFNVYGRRQDPSSDYAAVIPKFITCALKGEPLPIDGDGGQTRDFTYIDDVVDANINALTREGVPTTAVNIAYGQRTSVLELANAVIKATGSSSRIAYRPPRAGDVRDSLAALGLAKKHIGYSPRFDISSGLRETAAWFSKKA